MSEQIEDPTDETLGRSVSATLMAASVIGRRIAEELREQAARREQAEQAEAARLAQRYDAQHAVAQVTVEQADDRWMRLASPEDAAQAYATARAWSEVDPSFDPHAARIAQGIEDRWGVDVTAGDDEEALRRESDVERSKARSEDRNARTDEVVAGAVVAGTVDEVEALESAAGRHSESESQAAAADAADSQADAAGYDTDERRQQLAHRAREGGADAPTAEGRARAANANARPLKESTRHGRGQKKARRRGQQSQRTRSDQLSR